MTNTFRRYEILLPQQFNTRQPVPDDLVAETLLELRNCRSWYTLTIEGKVMSRRKKPKRPAAKEGPDEGRFSSAANGSDPAQVSGMFADDPTFEDFRKILRAQRESDYRKAGEEIEAMTREPETKGCSSSIPTRSRMTKTRTRSSAKE